MATGIANMRLTLKHVAASAALLALGACAQLGAITPQPQRAPDAAPLANAPAYKPSPDYRPVLDEDMILIETVHGTIVIELNNDFAPTSAQRMREMARANFLDGEYFYRVIDGFVAQAGVQHDERMTDWPKLKNENDRSNSSANFTALGNGDLFSPSVGHSDDAFPMARDPFMGREWLLHCPGAVAMARDEDPDTGSTEFYIVLDAQRYLDRNLTVFGRVVDGFQYVQKLERGDRSIESGVIQAPRTGDKMLSVRVNADLPPNQRRAYDVMRPNRPAFDAFKTSKRVRNEAFFYRKPPEVLDICGFEAPVRRSN